MYYLFVRIAPKSENGAMPLFIMSMTSSLTPAFWRWFCKGTKSFLSHKISEKNPRTPCHAHSQTEKRKHSCSFASAKVETISHSTKQPAPKTKQTIILLSDKQTDTDIAKSNRMTAKSFLLETDRYYPSNHFLSYWKLFSSIRHFSAHVTRRSPI